VYVVLVRACSTRFGSARGRRQSTRSNRIYFPSPGTSSESSKRFVMGTAHAIDTLAVVARNRGLLPLDVRLSAVACSSSRACVSGRASVARSLGHAAAAPGRADEESRPETCRVSLGNATRLLRSSPPDAPSLRAGGQTR